jgi:hypothetical protein
MDCNAMVGVESGCRVWIARVVGTRPSSFDSIYRIVYRFDILF